MNLKFHLALPVLLLFPWCSFAQRAAQAPKGGQTHIYKTVGEIKLPLYLYEPAGRQPGSQSPAIVFFFGGGWKGGSPTQFEEHCKYLAKRGMVTITVEYRVSSRHDAKIEDCIADARSAMRWVRAHAKSLGIDSRRIASGGAPQEGTSRPRLPSWTPSTARTMTARSAPNRMPWSSSTPRWQ